MRILFSVALVGLAMPAFAATILHDGGFEKPTTPAGRYVVYSSGQKFGPWSVVGASGNVGTVSSGFTQNGFTFNAKKGKAWLDLTGLSNTPTGVAQTVTTTAGATYTLTFWVGNVYNPGGIFGTTSTVNVYHGTTLLKAATNTLGQGSTTQVWQKFTVSFVASAVKTTLSFINGDPSSDTNCGLDAVSLTESAPN